MVKIQHFDFVLYLGLRLVGWALGQIWKCQNFKQFCLVFLSPLRFHQYLKVINSLLWIIIRFATHWSVWVWEQWGKMTVGSDRIFLGNILWYFIQFWSNDTIAGDNLQDWGIKCEASNYNEGRNGFLISPPSPSVPLIPTNTFPAGRYLMTVSSPDWPLHSQCH